MRKRVVAALLLGLALSAMQTAFAVPTFTTYTNLPSFQAALGGAPTVTQDFEALAPGAITNPILPGVTASAPDQSKCSTPLQWAISWPAFRAPGASSTTTST